MHMGNLTADSDPILRRNKLGSLATIKTILMSHQPRSPAPTLRSLSSTALQNFRRPYRYSL